jgi:hypothetical protein
MLGGSLFLRSIGVRAGQFEKSNNKKEEKMRPFVRVGFRGPAVEHNASSIFFQESPLAR